MGCDIHPFVFAGDKYLESVVPWTGRSYRKFAFLAGVRNYSGLPPMPWWGRGIGDMKGVSEYRYTDMDYHSTTWVSLDELLQFDYSVEMEDRRVTVGGDGGCTAEPGGGERMTYRVFLGQTDFFEDLDVLKVLQAGMGKVRIHYAFDN